MMADEIRNTEDKEIRTTVKCPACQIDVVWGKESPYRPFCSARCRDTDFMSWAHEEHILGGDSLYDDILSDDLPNRSG